MRFVASTPAEPNGPAAARRHPAVERTPSLVGCTVPIHEVLIPAGPSSPSEASHEAGNWIVPGQILFDRYRVEEKLGDGGMGEVWLVRHLELDILRALKLVLPRAAIHDSVRVRFAREARIMAELSHPNIVVVHGAQLFGNVAFIELEYIRGRSLDKVLSPGEPMPLDQAGGILDQLCDALQAAHDHQYVHRDLKPSNLLLVDGCPPGAEILKIFDFGIAKILGSDNRDTGGRAMTEGFLGTVSYASPEQFLDQAVDGRSDIYATGVILFEMLTGHRPFGGTSIEQMHGHAYLPPPSMAAKNPQAEVPPEVECVVKRCLAKNPADRPQSPRELAAEFRRARDQAPPSRRAWVKTLRLVTVSGTRPEARPSRRRQVVRD